jgi:Domain of unknown function (DUF4160)
MIFVPTVLRSDGLRVVIYPNDHRPAHVHIIEADCESVFNLGCKGGPVELRENYGFRSGRLLRIASVITDHLEELCEAWEKIHGNE